MSPSPKLVPIDELDQAIVDLSARINAATYELLVLIREFEDRAGYLKWGLKDATEWLAYRCDLSRSAAYEKVRVARALRKLPAISAAFSTGELSYSKVRALTRIAGDHNEQDLLDFALKTTATRVEERCREMRFGMNTSVDIASRARANRSLRLNRNAERGMMTVTVELPIESGELLEKALDKARDDNSSDTPEFAAESWEAQQADAFVNLVNEYLSDSQRDAADSSDNYLVTIHVDQSALADGSGRSAVPIETARRLSCDSHAVVLTEDDQGEPLNIGGETSVDNLMPLCTRHHPLVHEGQFRIEKDFQNNWIFVRPKGEVVPRNGYLPQDMTDDDIGRKYEESSAEDFLMQSRYVVSEPPPSVYRH